MTSRRAVTRELLLGTLLMLVVAAALVGPLVTADPSRSVTAPFAPPGNGLMLGSDGMGRDVWGMVLHGGSRLLGASVMATIVSMGVGVSLGLILCLRSRAVRALAFGLDLLLVIPPILLLMVLVFRLGGGTTTMVLVATAMTAPFVARYTRALALPLLSSEFVMAARLAGDSWSRVAVTEVLPNLWLPLLTDAGGRFIAALYLVASASFLGFDPLGGATDWASMVNGALPGLKLNSWAAIAPILAIAAVTFPANLLVDRLGRRAAR